LNQIENRWAEETFQSLLASWVVLTRNMKSRDPALQSALTQYASEIYQRFYHSRLVWAAAECDEDENPYEDLDQFEDMLESISFLGRLDVHNGINLLSCALSERLAKLQELGQMSESQIPTKSLNQIREELYWVIYMANYLVALNPPGETPEIPIEINELSANSPTDQADPVYCMIQTVFSLIHWHNQLVQTDPHHYLLSGYLARNLLSFLSRWMPSYLFCDSNEYAKNSPRFIQKYCGMEGCRVLDFVIQTCYIFMSSWAHDQDVAADSAKVLISISDMGQARNYVLSLGSWRPLLQLYLGANDATVSSYLMNSSNPTIHNFTRAIIQFSLGQSPGVNADYFKLVMTSITNRFRALLERPDFMSVRNRSDTLALVSHWIEVRIRCCFITYL